MPKYFLSQSTFNIIKWLYTHRDKIRFCKFVLENKNGGLDSKNAVGERCDVFVFPW